MRLTGQAFIIDLPQSHEANYSKRLQNFNGQTGVCVSYANRSDSMTLILRIGDQLIAVDHSLVRYHPDEMEFLAEEYGKLLKFKKQHPETEIGTVE